MRDRQWPDPGAAPPPIHVLGHAPDAPLPPTVAAWRAQVGGRPAAPAAVAAGLVEQLIRTAGTPPAGAAVAICDAWIGLPPRCPACGRNA